MSKLMAIIILNITRYAATVTYMFTEYLTLSRAVHLLPLWAFLACYRENLYLYLLTLNTYCF